MNTFGDLFRLTTFGESHGSYIGGVIDGIPAGIIVDKQLLKEDMNKRKPGQNTISSARKESDEVELLSGIKGNITTGAPIGFIIKNNNQKSKDYNSIKDAFRPSHADYTYLMKYGIRDENGGGRASARETACRVVGGAFAKMLIKQMGIEIKAYTLSIGKTKTKRKSRIDELNEVEHNMVGCPDPNDAISMIEQIYAVKQEGDSLGGIISCIIEHLPIGIGEPIYDKLSARLAFAMMSINAVKGFSIGDGFDITAKKGSQANDSMGITNGRVTFGDNLSGGVQGGISNGANVYFDVAFKPTSSIAQYQHTIDKNKQAVQIQIEGRHDPCIVPRAIVVVEAMAAMVIADFILKYQARLYKNILNKDN